MSLENPLTYWSSYIHGLKTKGIDEALNALYIRNEALNKLIRREFSTEGTSNSLLADPVFEAMFSWKHASKPIAELGLFHSKTLDSFDQKEAPFFRKSWKPYQHQKEAFELLLNPDRRNSIIVSSGTGSGKTECFLMPLIEDLVRERKIKQNRYQSGVRALFLYPLNALIDSQLERLSNWTKDFDGDIRFCRYNGQTPETSKNDNQHQLHPEQVFDRKTMRKNPAELLLTNPSMLERMLIRQEDHSIIEKTRKAKCFRWIIIDEAHTYLGSKAANLALLLRRVLSAFDVEPEEVHFVATSATIDASDDAACNRLRKFLQDISGTTADRVHLVLGKREIPRSISIDGTANHLSAQELLELAKKDQGETLLDLLKANPVAMTLRNHFIRKGFARLSTLQKQANLKNSTEALLWLDLLTAPCTKSGEPFLPLRMHLMLNSGATLKACPDANCAHKQVELQHKDWHWGTIWLDGRTHCECGAPLFPVVVCSRCNSVSLKGILQQDEEMFEDTVTPVIDDHESEALWMQAQLNGQEDIMVIPEMIDEESQQDPEVQNVLNKDDHTEKTDGLLDEAELVATQGYHTPILLCPPNSNNALISQVTWIDASGHDQCCDVSYYQLGQNEEGKVPCHACQQDLGITYFFQRSLSQRYLNHLMPYVLEYCSTDKPNKEADLPFSGKRLITFTDSRQGTARTSALLEREGERSLVAKFVFKMLSEGLTPEEQQRLADYYGHLKTVPASLVPLIQAQIDELESKESVKWNDLVDGLTESLSTSENTPIPHRSLVRAMWGVSNIDDSQRKDTARILLLREFISRPINGMSLETCGLFSLQYGGLESIDAPIQWIERGKTNEEWQAFLKLMIDFFVRDNHCVQLPNVWRRIGGNRRIYGKSIVPPGQPSTRTQISWPQIRNQGRQQKMLKWLAAFFNIDLGTCGKQSENGVLIDTLMATAFNQLRAKELLIIKDKLIEKSGYVLNLDKVLIVKNNSAWLFDGQNKLFDTIIGKPETAICPVDTRIQGAKAIHIPKVEFSQNEWNEHQDIAWNDHPESLRSEVRQFMNNNPDMRFLIENGIWNRLGTYAYEQTGFFASGEHTAQVSKVSKDQYVENFKKGLLNILACSTTMEMGVDLASINTVMMTNIPPHPANYMQRAGRAGRRKESRANTLTLCHGSPRDREIFINPDWALEGKQPSLHVTFNSEKIVRQHLQAQILSYYLKVISNALDSRTTLEEWIKEQVDDFLAWTLNIVEMGKIPEELAHALQLIARHTVLESEPIMNCVHKAHNAMAEHLKDWKATLLRFNTQIKDAKDDIVRRALEHHLNRFKDEHLYSVLTKNNYLPSTITIQGSTSFNNLTSEQEGKLAKKNLSSRIQLPSRDAHRAVFEYAPGASVLIDNRVYTSHGVTLNWKIPAAESNIAEVQSLKRFVACKRCHHKFLLTADKATEDAVCPECGKQISLEGCSEALIPSGYSVDETDSPHNDYSALVNYGYCDSIASVDDSWTEILPNKLSVRSSPVGNLLSYNNGFGYGYNLCLCCGWAEAVTKEQAENPELMKLRHKPLRMTQTDAYVVDGFCKGGEPDGSFRMKQGLYLVAETQTDCIEFVFENIDELDIPTNEQQAVGIGIGVVIRRAICQSLGVDEDEIGIAWRFSLRKRGFIISLYDHNNSGYCSSIRYDEIVDLLKQALKFLECPNNCDTACTSCLILFDTQRKSQKLNRHTCEKVLEYVLATNH